MWTWSILPLYQDYRGAFQSKLPRMPFICSRVFVVFFHTNLYWSSWDGEVMEYAAVPIAELLYSRPPVIGGPYSRGQLTNLNYRGGKSVLPKFGYWESAFSYKKSKKGDHTSRNISAVSCISYQRFPGVTRTLFGPSKCVCLEYSQFFIISECIFLLTILFYKCILPVTARAAPCSWSTRQ